MLKNTEELTYFSINSLNKKIATRVNDGPRFALAAITLVPVFSFQLRFSEKLLYSPGKVKTDTFCVLQLTFSISPYVNACKNSET